MKTVLVLAGLVAFALAGTVPQYQVETKSVDAEFVERQNKIFQFFHFTDQVNTESEYYKVGRDYDIEAHSKDYTDPDAVNVWLTLSRHGFLAKYYSFSIFNERMRTEAIALFNILYYAKDFQTFYNTAAYARVHLNDGLFYYAFYIAVFHRPDTDGMVLPAPYELFPEQFTNSETTYRIFRTKMQNGLINTEEANNFGIYKESDYYVYYSNYSNYWTYGDEEQRLSYFTEDVGLNTYYFFYHTFFPFWMETSNAFAGLKERRGEFYYYFYQQLLARYYMERLSNGLGEIPDFSWQSPLRTGYRPFMSTSALPYVQRNDYYYMQQEDNVEYLQFLDGYEKNFLQFLQKGHFKAYNHEVNLRDPKAINFVGNYWQANADLYEKSERFYLPSYEHIARWVLSASPEPLDKYIMAPAALNSYMTSVRDPAFFQLYSKIMNYIIQYKEHLEPYDESHLDYNGVQIKNVEVDRLVTTFEYFDFDASNAAYATHEELKSTQAPVFKIRQPRLTHKPFSVKVNIKSDVTGKAVVKMFLGPKFNSRGYPISLEDNWMNFVELDAYVQELKSGDNVIERKSTEFFYYKQDSIPTAEVMKLLKQGKAPVDMSEYYEWMPQRLMLPRGSEGGYPFQLFVFVYPYEQMPKEYEPFKDYFIDAKPLGYPLERPLFTPRFMQTNMFFQDVYINFEGEHLCYYYNNPFYIQHSNEVTKH